MADTPSMREKEALSDEESKQFRQIRAMIIFLVIAVAIIASATIYLLAT